MRDEDLLEELIRVPSPTGSEAQVVRFLQEQARLDGFQVEEDAVGNFIASAGEGPRTLLFVGHVDTVPGEVPVRVEDGELWGRGSVDAKGALAAAYCAARWFVGSSDVRIVVVGAVDEEGRSQGVRGLRDDFDPEWIINGEPSGANGLTLAYKGIVRGRLSVERETAHPAGPELGASDLLVDAWTTLRDRFGMRATFDSVQGRLDSLYSTTDGLMERAMARFQLRLPPGVSPDAAQGVLQETAEQYDARLVVDEAVAAVTAARRTALVAAFTNAIRQAGGTPRLLRKTGTSDMNRLAVTYPGVPIVAYGPGDSALDHRPDERLSLAEFRRALEVLTHVYTVFEETKEAASGQEGPMPRRLVT